MSGLTLPKNQSPLATRQLEALRGRANQLRRLASTPEVLDQALDWFTEVETLERSGELTLEQTKLLEVFIERMRKIFPEIPF